VFQDSSTALANNGMQAYISAMPGWKRDVGRRRASLGQKTSGLARRA
jgi:hypothetical protein